MPQPGQAMPVMALKGQKAGTASVTVSIRNIPVAFTMMRHRKRAAHDNAILLGMRYCCILFAEKFVYFILLDRIRNNVQSYYGKDKA